MAQVPQDEVRLGPGDVAARVAVVALGVLIVMMIALIAYTIVSKKGTSARTQAAEGPVLTLDVGSGAWLVDKQLVGETLMLEIETATGREIVLLDARSGDLIRHIRLRSP